MADQFPSERQIGIFLFLFSLLLYLVSMSWSPFPGLPTHELMLQLKLESTPGVLDSLWGWLLRVFVRLPGLSVSAWAGLFSAICGAACVSLLGRLMTRVGYLIRNEPGPQSFIREAQARRISGLVAGLYLACCIPFWVVSTRSLPGSFHLLLLLAAVWFFSQYQHWGKRRYLVLLGLFYGIGIPEFATFIVFLPLTICLVAREMFRWKCMTSWRTHLLLWSGFLLGLSFYLFNAYVLYRRGAYLGLYPTMWQALFEIFNSQMSIMFQVRYSPGFPVIMFFALVPWLTLFAMSRRSPWFYEWGQVLVRFIFLGGGLAVLFNAPFSPWKLLGFSYVMVTPYLILAVCVGYMAGEFWILGEKKVMGDPSWGRDASQFLSTLIALLLPVVVLIGGGLNWRAANGREGAVLEEAAFEILDRLDGRDILFSMGLLDRQIRLAVWEQHLPVRVISAPRTASPVYLKRLAPLFSEQPLRQALWEGDFNRFLETLLSNTNGPGRVGIIDMPDVFREFGYLVPDGLLYRLESSRDLVNLPALIEEQRPFWARMESMAQHLAPEDNPVRFYQNQLLLLASKVANNLGVMQAKDGDEDGALETFQVAWRLYPKNISVLLNLLALSHERELPESEELEEEWADLQNNSGGERWALALRYGYVLRAREWVRRGYVWALSGAPTADEDTQNNPVPMNPEDKRLVQLLDQAYQKWGSPSQNESYFRSLLMRNTRDTGALMSLCRFAIRRKDLAAAKAYMQEAMAMGLPEESVLFDQAMLQVVQGDTPLAVELLRKLSHQTPGDPRVFLALLLLTDRSDPINAEAQNILKTHRGIGINGRLTLARFYSDGQNWADAQAQLEQALQIDSSNTRAWEMMVLVAQAIGNPALGKSSLRALLERNPEHFLQYQEEGVRQYQKGDLAKAEENFRQGVAKKRDATLLNNLAQVILDRGGDREEALALVNEALTKRPGDPAILNTRGAIYQKMGRYEEARIDLQDSLTKKGSQKHVLLMLAESYEELGDRQQALTLGNLARKPEELTEDEIRQVRELIKRNR